MAYTIASLDELGEGYGFRKIRKALGVTAFGVNALVFPPSYDGPAHYHDMQDELYFVHRGTATFAFDGDEHVVGEGGLVHVESTTHRESLELAPTRTSSSSSSAARTATSSATAISSAPRTSRSGTGALAMNGLMMDYQLTLPTLLRRVGDVLPRQGDRHPAARQELPPLHLPRLGAPRAARSRSALQEPRSRARRPRRDALLEPLPAPRGVLRHPVRRLRPAHAQPAPAPERPRVHREPRRGQGGDRRPQPAAAARARSSTRRRSSTCSSSRTPTRSCSRGRARTPGSTPSSTRTRPRRCATRAARPAGRRASLYSHRSTILHTLGVAAGNPLGLGISEQDVILPVVPMFHANAWGYPYLATMIGAKLVYPGPHLDPESLLDDFVAGAA